MNNSQDLHQEQEQEQQQDQVQRNRQCSFKHVSAQFLLQANAIASQVVSMVVSDPNLLENHSKSRKTQGRFMRRGSLHSIEDSFWRKLDGVGDEKEFLFFISLSRDSFGVLVELCRDSITNMPMDNRHKTRRHNTASRRHPPRDITAVGLKYLVSRGEHKEIYVQFGMTQTMYLHCLRIALDLFVKVLEFNDNSRLWWDQTVDSLRRTAELTSKFVDIPNVFGMIDRMKLPSSSPADPLLQNRDYNG